MVWLRFGSKITEIILTVFVNKISQPYPTGGLAWKITASENSILLFWKILFQGML